MFTLSRRVELAQADPLLEMDCRLYQLSVLLVIGTTLSYAGLCSNLTLETCLRTKFHVDQPKPTQLFGQCALWSNLSCCSEEVSKQSHEIPNQYGFRFAPCGEDSLSQQCFDYFVRDLCYFNCDPYTGPWIVRDPFSERERIKQVPLCESDCIEWWNACADSLTCVRNWRKHFDWGNHPTLNNSRSNFCPNGTECQVFRNVYKDAVDFCETVWDNSWKVVPDTEQCITFNFKPTQPNPNRAVAQFYTRCDDHETDLFLLQICILALMGYICFRILIKVIRRINQLRF